MAEPADTSIAKTSPAPPRAAAMASAPLPVQRSRTLDPGTTSFSTISASIQVSLRGRKTPGGATILRELGELTMDMSETRPPASTAERLRAVFDQDAPPT